MVFLSQQLEQSKTNAYNTNKKKSKVTILISDRADFRAREVIRDREALLIKGSILQYIKILNMHVPKN